MPVAALQAALKAVKENPVTCLNLSLIGSELSWSSCEEAEKVNIGLLANALNDFEATYDCVGKIDVDWGTWNA